MNTIQARSQTSKYVDQPHLVLLIDGAPLDVLLAKKVSSSYLEGLIPPFAGLDDPDDWQLLLTRMRLAEELPTSLPVLVCPDDVDLSCTVVIADVRPLPDRVLWCRLGTAQRSIDYASENLGEHVEWFKGIGPFEFKRSEYDAAMRAFQSERQPD